MAYDITAQPVYNFLREIRLYDYAYTGRITLFLKKIENF